MKNPLLDTAAQLAPDLALKRRLDQMEARQDGLIRDLRLQVKTLSRTRRGGGFPWGLLLVAGGVYLYRTNSSVKGQIDGLLDRVNPGIKGNLARAGDAAKQAVSSVLKGEDASGAAQDALGELKQAGHKGLDQAHDLGEAVKRGEEGVKA